MQLDLEPDDWHSERKPEPLFTSEALVRLTVVIGTTAFCYFAERYLWWLIPDYEHATGLIWLLIDPQ